MSAQLKHTDVIERLCKLHSEVWAAVIDVCSPADCFCGTGGFWDTKDYNPDRDYRNDGLALEWIERVVREKMAETRTPDTDMESHGQLNAPTEG